MADHAAIATTGLTKHYPGVAALTGLTLEVPAGSIYGFLGPNGAGKSTTIKLLAGLTRPTSGTSSVAGIPVSAGADYRREVGYLAQEPRFYDWMTGRETLRFVTSLYPTDRRSDDSAITALLARVGLADAGDRKTGTYSGGMRQRLGIAQALVGRPSVLLLDEPVSSLDPIGRREVLELMQDLKGETTVFYSTHILDDVERVSDHVAILDAGKLVRAEPTAQLLASFTKDRLRVGISGASDTTRAELAALPGVESAEQIEQAADLRAYVLRVAPNAAKGVQSAVTRFAAEHNLTVTENQQITLGLEDVFMRLVNQKEHAA
ncbi:MAG TPA: ABC transporter ATP-binding protein [Candidatus Limnocylindrales bacterium]